MITPSKKILTRRNVLRGMFAAPAIIAIDNLMPVKAYAFVNRDPNIVWYKGKTVFDSAFYYCPYVPLEKTRVTAKSRKLGAEWTIEIKQPLKHMYDPSIETLIMNMLKEQKPL